ncbi:MAG: dihydrolipoyl dehydrogenase [Acidobacteriia bacterium]|nr:dihydrolipoyl dehydrogenase [Terriglobia bacterium]
MYDLVIIGSGPGGYVAGIRAGQLGLKTIIVEKDDRFGGTCLLRGCIPTKALLFNAKLYQQFLNSKEFGISFKDISLDWKVVQQRKNKIVAKNAKGVEFLLRKNKVESLRGFGTLESPNKVRVKTPAGEEKILETKHIIIATGSEPKSFPNVKIDGTRIITNNEALELEAVPQSMVIVGAGAVGVEFASIYARFGSHITLIEMLPQILPFEDAEVAAELQRSFRKQGITVKTKTALEKVEVKKDAVAVTVKSAEEGKSVSLEAQKVLMAVGRAPNTANIGLEKIGIQADRGYIPINDFMQTRVPSVYAIGDIVPKQQLAHLASFEAHVAVEHMAGLEPRPINYDHCPNCTYCDPEVASIGWTEAKAIERGHKVKIGKFPFQANGKANIIGESEGFVKIVSDEKFGEILGVHIIGPHATDLIAEAGAAMTLEATAEDLAQTIHAHPTVAEAVGEAAHAAFDMAIHI